MKATAFNRPATENLGLASALIMESRNTPHGQKTTKQIAPGAASVSSDKSPIGYQAAPKPLPSARLIEPGSADHGHLLLTINAMRNIALKAQQQGVITRQAHSNLIEDISQSLHILSGTGGGK